ncbi:MAG: chemotaxis protein CheA [Deltaproteobacteria bacterium]|nr:chemotaxis protein CheA [Deltaproteobacteria bacterium]
MTKPRPPGKRALVEFLSEAQEIIETLSRDLLDLEKGTAGGKVDPDVLNGAFRAAHTLKGMSGMFGVQRMSRLAHRMEDGLDALRMGRVPLEAALLDLLFEGIEILGEICSEVSDTGSAEGPGGGDDRIDDLVRRLEMRLERSGKAASDDPLDTIQLATSIRQVLTEYEEHRLRENVRQGASLFRVIASFDLMTFDGDLSELSARLKGIGEVVSTLPSGEASSDTRIDFELILGTEASLEVVVAAAGELAMEVQPILRVGQVAPSAPSPLRGASLLDEPARPAPAARPLTQVGATAVRPLEDDPDAEAAAAALEAGRAPEAVGSLRSVSRTVRVDIGRLDALMNLLGELVLTKVNIQRISDRLKQSNVATKLSGELQKESRLLERKLEELQAGVLDVRMVPLAQLFDKLSRMVRKTSRESGKEVDFTVAGGETELDKLIIEDLSDPLMHLIRNAIDHGIESPEEREARGKPRSGQVKLRAYQEGNHVVIEVQDDGAGMNEAAIVDTAIKRGLITASEIGDLSSRDIFGLVFLPGFSTASAVTDLSGRGVGLDVVKHNVAALSGIIDVRSQPGEGTTFALTLPITLAILQALVVQAKDQVFALPLSGVLEILRVNPEEVRRLQGQAVIDLRGATLPLVRLARLFELDEEELPSGRFYVTIVGLAQNRIAVALDGLLGQQDVVIKGLGDRLAKTPGIAGATDLGDQRTTLVIDVAGLIEEVLEGRESKAKAS